MLKRLHQEHPAEMEITLPPTTWAACATDSKVLVTFSFNPNNRRPRKAGLLRPFLYLQSGIFAKSM